MLDKLNRSRGLLISAELSNIAVYFSRAEFDLLIAAVELADLTEMADGVDALHTDWTNAHQLAVALKAYRAAKAANGGE